MNHYEEREATPDPLTNIDAEAALLGAMLIDNAIINDTADRLRPDDFADPLHGRIYSAILRFVGKGVKPNAISLKPLFKMDEEAGHGEYLDRLVESPMAVIGAADFVAQILDLSDRRVTRAALDTAREQLEGDFERPLAEIASRVESAAFAASSRQATRQVRSLSDMIALTEERIERIQDQGESIGMTNRFVPDMDVVLGPLETGYHILAGRAGMGKTSVAHSAALGYSAEGNPGIYLSAEMTPEQLAMRAAVDLAFAMGYRIKHDDVKRGRVTPQERVLLRKVGQQADMLPIDYVDVRNSNIRRVWTEIARRKAIWAAEGRVLKYAVIDYLGLFSADIDGKNIDDDRKRMNFISAFVLAMSHALDVAIIALAQVSRGVESRVNKRPMLQDLKETGNLEQDADSVTFVYREEYYLEQSEPPRDQRDKAGVNEWEEWDIAMRAARNKLDLIGAKNRHGRNVTRTCNFFGAYYAVRAVGVLDIGDNEPLLEF